jgi:hypothetical protein
MVETANSVPVGAHKHNGVRPVCLPTLSHFATPSRIINQLVFIVYF